MTEALKNDEFVFTALLDETGRRLATGAEKGDVRLWPLPHVPTPVPEAFLDFAEAVAGIRLSPRGTTELVPRFDFKTRPAQFFDPSANHFFARLAQWFVAPPDQRSQFAVFQE
jgi:hypothetical protein